MSFQRVIVVGNLGRDPEMRYTPDGTPVTNLNVATNRRWTNRDGSQGEETVWFRVTVWGKQAENTAQYLSKGRLVLVEGRMNPDPNTGGPRVYQRQDGTWGASYEITARNIRFLGGRGATSDEYSSAAPSGEGEDIPF